MSVLTKPRSIHKNIEQIHAGRGPATYCKFQMVNIESYNEFCSTMSFAKQSSRSKHKLILRLAVAHSVRDGRLVVVESMHRCVAMQLNTK